jgi:itaconate CoA-transferase
LLLLIDQRAHAASPDDLAPFADILYDRRVEHQDPAVPPAGPLAGVVVVSFEHAVAAPFATRHLADLGARVVKVERPGRGDFARGYDDAVHGLSSFFVWLNRGKESLALDVKATGASEVMDRLITSADVVVHNLSDGAAERLGITPEQLLLRHPELVAAAISGYGAPGPYTGRKAYDLLVQAETGLLSVTGTEEAPSKVGASVADIAAGTYVFSGVLAALYQRERTGRGTAVSISMLDALAEWMGAQAHFGHHTGRRPARTGAHHATIAPYGPYRCQDGREVFVAVQNDDEWRRLCTDVLGDAALASDARFATNVSRVRHREGMDRSLVPALALLPSAALTHRLDEGRIAWAVQRDVGELHDHPQLQARGRWIDTDSPVGPIPTLVPPLGLHRVPVHTRLPGVGEDTDAVLHQLGYSPEEIGELHARGVVE